MGKYVCDEDQITRSTSSIINNNIDTMITCLNTLSSEVDVINSNWDGEASEAFKNAMTEYLNYFTSCVDYLNDFVLFIDDAKSKIMTKDSELTSFNI